VISYFAQLSKSKLILWCYLAWYIAIVVLYFDSSPFLWLSSIGISAFIGLALNLATYHTNQKRDNWVIFRLFLIPFCVSSYSALIKGKGVILLFPPNLHEFFVGLFACACVVAIHLICKACSSSSKHAEQDAATNP
jgi:hypothetical protein